MSARVYTTNPLLVTTRDGIGGICWCMSRPIQRRTAKLATSSTASPSQSRRVVSMEHSLEERGFMLDRHDAPCPDPRHASVRF
jgi:hypothetical protein